MLSCSGITYSNVCGEQLQFFAAHQRSFIVLKALSLTLTTGFGSVPFRSLAVAHDTRQGRMALQQVARLAMKCHHRSQLVVRTHSSAIHYVPGIKTGLPQFCCQSKKTTKLLQQNNC